MSTAPRSRRGFKVAIFCALPLEAEAVQSILDTCWEDLDKEYGKEGGRSEHIYHRGDWEAQRGSGAYAEYGDCQRGGFQRPVFARGCSSLWWWEYVVLCLFTHRRKRKSTSSSVRR